MMELLVFVGGLLALMAIGLPVVVAIGVTSFIALTVTGAGGLPVELLFSAFEQSTTPRVPGTVQLVSADRLEDERSGDAYYAVRIRVDDAGMQKLGGLRIRPGMPVEAFVRTGERSLLNYLFKPLLDRTHLALAED